MTELERLQRDYNELREAHDKAVRRQKHTEYWYAVRLERIKDTAKRVGIWDEVSAIIANGDATRQLADGTWHHEPPTYAQQLNRAVHRVEAAEALIAPLAAVGAELVRAEAGEEWKAEIPDDKAIFAFCGKAITAGQLRAAATFVSRPAEQKA